MFGFDFFIRAVAGSGSHMLQSALNSHPEIQCADELHRGFFKATVPVKGIKQGGILYGFKGITVPVIILKRDIRDICKRHLKVQSTKVHHFKEPVEIEVPELVCPEYRLERIKEEQDNLRYGLEGPVLQVTYEELCGDTDTRVLNKSKEICMFLGVEVRDLVPDTYKPTIISPPV